MGLTVTPHVKNEFKKIVESQLDGNKGIAVEKVFFIIRTWKNDQSIFHGIILSGKQNNSGLPVADTKNDNDKNTAVWSYITSTRISPKIYLSLYGKLKKTLLGDMQKNQTKLGKNRGHDISYTVVNTKFNSSLRQHCPH